MNKRKYRIYTKEFLEPIVKSSSTYAECMRKMGVIPTGGSYKHLTSMIHRFDIDTSHMLGQGHNKDKEFIKFEDLTKPASIKNRLIKYRGHICQVCELAEWNSISITLESEHVNGNSSDNSQENLLLLCPNCHSQTPTWRGSKNSLLK